jgi:hypothetical protein
VVRSSLQACRVHRVQCGCTGLRGGNVLVLLSLVWLCISSANPQHSAPDCGLAETIRLDPDQGFVNLPHSPHLLDTVLML